MHGWLTQIAQPANALLTLLVPGVPLDHPLYVGSGRRSGRPVLRCQLHMAQSQALHTSPLARSCLSALWSVTPWRRVVSREVKMVKRMERRRGQLRHFAFLFCNYNNRPYQTCSPLDLYTTGGEQEAFLPRH
eukprot:3249175-Pleurochrysis_carterae.AAC.1